MWTRKQQTALGLIVCSQWTIYVVTSNSSAFPHLKKVISLPEDRVNWKKLDPTDKEMQIISPERAETVLGDHAIVLDGVTIILYDTKQFMAHYYHWWGEIILGAIRIYSTMSLVPGIKTPLAEISRFLLPLEDRAGVNGPLMRAAFPTASIERGDHWQDFIALNQTFVFERAMIVSRTGAHQSPLAGLWGKMVSSTMNVTVPDRFWEPLRLRLVKNTVGYFPVLDDTGAVLTGHKSSAPIVTYVSRQRTGRRLTEDDHQGLIKSLLELEADGLIELNIAVMETMTFSKQIETVARSTIMVGVHGNGLTHQLWMPPSSRSTVIEILYPGDYLHDYEMLARNMGHIVIIHSRY
ncbi:hypothetical protein CPB84DRAFT_1744161 [Gymnopilus junonius]|uniref:Glycosyltransferase 61 catalytic domain-containing protein n=1 Tax=Gymnopilus junonius TaxID=109634 RepID=A0A9P5TS19_GYMJU|nr:hypothetical protein CPB84DRAFT_1744161 [Gymnopilus junonius]